MGAMLFGFGFVMVAKYYPLRPIYEENAWLAFLLIAIGAVMLFVEDVL
jgi:hypothetical protein